jgi:hypothetical protein
MGVNDEYIGVVLIELYVYYPSTWTCYDLLKDDYLVFEASKSSCEAVLALPKQTLPFRPISLDFS